MRPPKLSSTSAGRSTERSFAFVEDWCATVFCFWLDQLFTLSLLVGCSGSSFPSTATPIPAPVAPANNPAPTITSISPTGVLAGSSSQTLNVTGSGYISSTAATLNGAALQTTYVSGTSLQVAVPASALAAGQVGKLVLSKPSPGGGSSGPSSLSIMSLHQQ
jgi:hypothetical protein